MCLYVDVRVDVHVDIGVDVHVLVPVHEDINIHMKNVRLHVLGVCLIADCLFHS